MSEATPPFLTPQSRTIVGAMRVSFLLLLVPQVVAGQRTVDGTVYDSLLHAPLRGADVWVRGSEQHVQTDSDGRFHVDSIAPGRYTLLVSHPGLDSAGRSEEHTSELQSRPHLVCRLLLEKKKINQ